MLKAASSIFLCLRFLNSSQFFDSLMELGFLEGGVWQDTKDSSKQMVVSDFIFISEPLEVTYRRERLNNLMLREGLADRRLFFPKDPLFDFDRNIKTTGH